MIGQMSQSGAQAAEAGPSAVQQASGIFGVAAIISGAMVMNPDWGAWTAWAKWPLVVSVVLFIACMAIRLRGGAGRRRRGERMAGGLRPLMGQGWNPETDMKASRFSKGRPQKVVLNYSDSIVDTDPDWRAKVETMVKARMNVDALDTKWDTKRGRAVFRAKTTWTDEELVEKKHQEARERVHDILRPMFGTKIEVEVMQWQNDEGETR